LLNAEATRYPLTWPATWPRTHAANRQRATFSKSISETTTQRDELGRDVRQVKRRSLDLSTADAATRLEDQIARLGGTEAILSTNQRLRMDGRPKQNEGEPSDVGAAVYFRLKGKPRCLACDKWDRVADNVAALAAHIDALRRIDRYGVGTMDQAFAGYTALPAASTDWRAVFDLNGNHVTFDEVDARHRTLAMIHHPDRGGDPAMMARINAARDAARKELVP